MKRELNVLFLLVIILFAIGLVFAAGGGGGGGSSDTSRDDTSSSEDTTDNSNNSSTDTDMDDSDISLSKGVKRKAKERIKNVTDKSEAARICEDASDRIERIACRLAWANKHKRDYEGPSGSIPEACRGHGNRELCVKLYADSDVCYDMEGSEKNRCFKRVSGFVKGNLKDEDPKDRPLKAKKYLNVLLYDLQEKIEKANEKGKITDEDSAVLIDKIIEIKGLILGEGTKGEIKLELKDLRKMIQEVKQKIDDSDDIEDDDIEGNETGGEDE